MESESENKPADASAASKQERSSNSTIEFPYNDLDNAIEIVRGIHEVQGTACDYEQLAAHLKQEPKGGGFRLRITGTKCYGLITYERGGRLTLTDLGKQIIEAESEKAAKITAFLNVPLYQRVFDEFKGRQLPPQAGLERSIQSMGVGDKVKDKARQVMLRSAKQAGFFDLSADRLTMPPNRAQPAKPSGAPNDQQQDKNGQGSNGSGGNGVGGGNGGDGMHPLIQGLLLTLPKPGSTWTAPERMNWLVMANSIFKMIYTSDNSGDVEIKMQDGGRSM
jgi:hypothetical protein